MWYTDVQSVDDKAEYNHQVTALTDLLTMSLVIGVDVTCTLLSQLRQQLCAAVKQLQFLVPHSVYLPAPPVYCPQPAITNQVNDGLMLVTYLIMSVWHGADPGFLAVNPQMT